MDDLHEDSSPVDGVDGGEFVPGPEVGVHENRLDHKVKVVRCPVNCGH